MFHINFMRIHPFEDGNKRCAKIILASNLLKSFCAPIIITEEDTKEYYKYINNCDYDGFAEFLRKRSKLEIDTLVSLFKMKYNIPMDETPEKEYNYKTIYLIFNKPFLAFFYFFIIYFNFSIFFFIFFNSSIN